MSAKEKNIAIVLSAGRGTRMNTALPKQYLDLCGRPVLFWSLQAFEDFAAVEEVILVASEEDLTFCREEIVKKYQLSKVRKIVPGGSERYLSVWSGLKAIDWERGNKDFKGINDIIDAGYVKNISDGKGENDAINTKETDDVKNSIKNMKEMPEDRYVFIHDGARPLLDQGMLDRLCRSVREYRAAVAAMPVKDTIKIADEENFAVSTPDRRTLWQVQTPQVFEACLIRDAYEKLIQEKASDVTDDAMVLEREAGIQVKLVEGSYRNLKITTPEDLLTAEALMRERFESERGMKGS